MLVERLQQEALVAAARGDRGPPFGCTASSLWIEQTSLTMRRINRSGWFADTFVRDRHRKTYDLSVYPNRAWIPPAALISTGIRFLCSNVSLAAQFFSSLLGQATRQAPPSAKAAPFDCRDRGAGNDRLM